MKTSVEWVAAVVAVYLISLPLPVNAATSGCDAGSVRNGTCAQISEDEAQLIGSRTLPGAPGSAEGTAPGVNAPGGPVDPRDRCEFVLQDRCNQVVPRPGDPEAPAAPVTLADIASFRPEVGATGMEPNGWAIVGLPANFYSGAAEQVQSGTLLGQPADVRFTPIAYSWDYGDGRSASFDGPGASWQQLGLEEFDATPTSHVFGEEGTFTVSHSVEFVADYRFAGGPWVPIAGSLTIAGPAQTVLVGDADTVLVESECTSRPTAPGC